jgi:signal transduction histidine kinase
MTSGGELDYRVLILAPTGRDGPLVQAALSDGGIAALACTDVAVATAELKRGAGALLAAEEVLDSAGYRTLALALASQPPWSDLPVLVMRQAGGGSEALAKAVARLGNVTLLDRPMPVSTLVAAAHSALRARRRQYETRAAEQRKDTFIATLSHELRNPLAPIRNAARFLRSQHPGQERAGWAIDMIERQVDHLKRLVDDLLDVARLTQGKVVLQPETVELSQVVGSAIEVSLPLLESRRHNLRLALPDHPVQLHGDPVRLAQVLSNLLDNAAKYTPEGGDVELAAAVDADWVLISVTDNGIGLDHDEAAVSRLFTIFSQGEAENGAMHGGGLGIGLSLVKAFVEMHGGSVEARSAGPGQGACFAVKLPLPAAASVGGAPRQAAAS